MVLVRAFLNFISFIIILTLMWIAFFTPLRSMAAPSPYSVAIGGGGASRLEEDWSGYMQTSSYSNGFLALGYGQNHWVRIEMATAFFESGNETLQVNKEKRNYSLWYSYESEPLVKWILVYLEAGLGISQPVAQTKLYDEVSTDKGRNKVLMGAGFGIRPEISWGWISAGVRALNIQGERPGPTLEAIIGLGIHTR